MGRIVTTKMKEILQAPTPESKIVDEATLENMEEPNWGLNLRICAMINSEEFSGTEIVKAIKKKLLSKSVVSQRLSLDVLETCSSNCEKVFSEIASEKVLDDMVRMIQDERLDYGNRMKGSRLIRAWGENEDLMYLPVFRQTHMFLKTSGAMARSRDGNSPTGHYTLESHVNQQPMSPPERYPMPDMGLQDAEDATLAYDCGGSSLEENKEFLTVTRNSLDLLSSILNSGLEPIPIKDELTVSMVDKCKQSLPVVRRVAENTTDNDIILFEALNLHDELQQVISKCEEIEGALASGGAITNTSDANKLDIENHAETRKADSPRVESTESSSEVKEPVPYKEGIESSKEAKESVSLKEESAEQRQLI